jgi:hypothetical protein
MPTARQEPTTDFKNDPNRLLSLRDLAAIGVMAEGTARNRMSAGTYPIPVVRVGANVKVRLGDVLDYIENQRDTDNTEA